MPIPVSDSNESCVSSRPFVANRRTASDLPTSPGHPFYARLTTLLDGHDFDRFVEGLCHRFYAPVS